MKAYNIAILGATGAVGQEMLVSLQEQQLPIGQLYFLAGKSAGTKLTFMGKEHTVLFAEDFDFKEHQVDIVLGAADNGTAKRLAPKIVAAGAVFIDNSSAFRMDPNVPLVVPEINPQDVTRQSGIISNPNCSTIIALTAIWPIVKKYGLRSIVASTYQAVSGAGAAGFTQLESENMGRESESPAFSHKIAGNVIPMIGALDDSGHSREEVKMQNEGRKILHIPELVVSCTCVRVPVARCHSISLNIRTQQPANVNDAREAIQAGDGVALMDTADLFPMPVNTENQDTVFVGRIRPDATAENGLCLWCCGDQLRKGAASNAVQIAKVWMSAV